MKVTKNIGMVNVLIRITIGLTILSWSTAKMVKHPWRDSYLFMALCGAMKVAEGIVRFCPITALYQEAKNNDQHQNDPTAGETKEAIDMNDVIPYNPT